MNGKRKRIDRTGAGRYGARDVVYRLCLLERATMAAPRSMNIEEDSTVIFSGWLEKKSPTGMVKGWKKRWFIITEDQLDAQMM